MAKQFRYFRDPLFLTVLGLYFVNRWAIKPLTVGKVHFFHWYFNDLICAPFWLPGLFWLYRRLGLRGHDEPPSIYEVLFHLTIWTFVFEVVTPAQGKWFGYPTADPWDVVFYFAGGIVSVVIWNWGGRSCREAKPPSCTPTPTPTCEGR